MHIGRHYVIPLPRKNGLYLLKMLCYIRIHKHAIWELTKINTDDAYAIKLDANLKSERLMQSLIFGSPLDELLASQRQSLLGD